MSNDDLIAEIDCLLDKLDVEHSKYLIKQIFKKSNINRIRCTKHSQKNPDIDLNNIYVINLFSQLKRMFYQNSSIGMSMNIFRPLIDVYTKNYLNSCKSVCKDCVIEYSVDNPLTCSHGTFTEIRCCNICQRLTLNCYSCRDVMFSCDICNIKCCRKCVMEIYIVNNTDKICKNCTYTILHKYFEPDIQKIMNRYRMDAASSI